jgi:RNA polymerase sigma factor (sigma-70 family)
MRSARDDDARTREALTAGSATVLAEVYDAYSSAVYGIALRITHDHGAAEDVTQEVFVELWQRPERFDPGQAPLRGWLCMIARRRAIDWRRRQVTRDRYTLLLAGQAVPAPNLQDDVEAGTIAKAVRAAVHDLPPLYRDAIALAYYYGLTYREVAKELGIPEGTAKYRLRAGLRRLGDSIGDAVLAE